MLYSYDKLGNEALDRLDEISPPMSKGWKCPHSGEEGQRDLYALLRDNAVSDKTLHCLWTEISEPPDWVDWEQIARGQRIVYQFNGQILVGVGVLFHCAQAADIFAFDASM